MNGGLAQAFEADGQNDLTVDAGTYSVTEPAVDGYMTSYDGVLADCARPGATATCTVTNDDQAATLIVKKVVVNDDGGTATADDFSFQVNGGQAQAFELDGQNDLTVNAGTYSVTEPGVVGYATSYSNCSELVIPNGGSATCTITNDDVPATLIVKKVVVNDNGGTKQPQDFSFQVNGGQAQAFEADGQNDLEVAAGTYDVTEPAVAGYTTTYQGCADIELLAGWHGDLHRHQQRRPARSGLHRRPEVGEPDDGEGAGRPGDVLGDDHEYLGRRRRRNPERRRRQVRRPGRRRRQRLLRRADQPRPGREGELHLLQDDHGRRVARHTSTR